MLKLTDNAASIVNSIAEQSDAAGLRITANGEPAKSFDVAAVTAAQPNDQVVEKDGATVYLDAAAATELADKVLDAGVDGTGNAQFAISDQA